MVPPLAFCCTAMKSHREVEVVGYPAHVRYIGPTHFASGEWIGVELEPGQAPFQAVCLSLLGVLLAAQLWERTTAP